MADSSVRGLGKPSAAGPGTPSGAKAKGRRTQGGKVVESRYLQYEKKTTKKQAPATDTLKTSEKMPENGRKPNPLQKNKGVAVHLRWLPNCALLTLKTVFLVLEKSVLRKTPQLEKTISKKTESTSFSASRKKNPDLFEAMEVMESQTLLLTLLTVKIENSLAAFEEKAERNLLMMCQEKAELQKKVHELKRNHLLCQRKRELLDILDAQIEILSPYEAVAERFKEQYKMFAMALDTTRHELPLRSIHLDGDGQQFLDDLQQELMATRHLLGEFGIGSSDENGKVLDLLSELKEITQKKDLELRRSFVQVLELSAGANKEAALINQDVWEEVQGSAASRQWYFNEEGACGEAQGGASSPLVSGAVKPHAL
ncbi:HAUS augmin-like complex subunit 8 isoform X3 [Rousettus aegyptiacus]|uniref:HAUS augmin-like complex subunit 8 isoform X3 n=1 Tax=Rousettus aegyptiacus TaxID=9407 RepID=UPI00168D149E|nr:HAUS augmin-like complex subunit 8 isoform X3 [Rousettus aegyptiacus]